VRGSTILSYANNQLQEKSAYVAGIDHHIEASISASLLLQTVTAFSTAVSATLNLTGAAAHAWVNRTVGNTVRAGLYHSGTFCFAQLAG
jgi:hypothetical protein